jgi:hypothetical protein
MVRVSAVVAMVMPVEGKGGRGKHCRQEGSNEKFLHGSDCSSGWKVGKAACV